MMFNKLEIKIEKSTSKGLSGMVVSGVGRVADDDPVAVLAP
jgi:hypothetical protein